MTMREIPGDAESAAPAAMAEQALPDFSNPQAALDFFRTAAGDGNAPFGEGVPPGSTTFASQFPAVMHGGDGEALAQELRAMLRADPSMVPSIGPSWQPPSAGQPPLEIGNSLLDGVGDVPRGLAMPLTPGNLTTRYAPNSSDSDPASASVSPAQAGFDVAAVRRDFPALHQQVNGKPLIWLDNAATTHKPQCVIDAVSQFFARDNSNIHRAAHTLAARATDAYETARQKVQVFLGAASPNEVVFTRGTTEAINLVAQTYGRQHVAAGDEILITTLEHHANIVPWQMLAQEKNAILRVVPITEAGDVSLADVAANLSRRTRIVAISHVSNVLGTVLPVSQIAALAHTVGAVVLVDGAQAVAHVPVNVRMIDADFYVFSGHKIFAPTAVGVLYGREQLLREMPPWQGGGNMIDTVTFEKTTYSPPPAKFEAGTGVLAEAVGLGAALEYLGRIGMESLAAYEHYLADYGMAVLSTIPGLRMIGTVPGKVGVFSFVMDGVPATEVGQLLDLEGIAVRSGHHCAQPTMARYGVPATVRPSVAFYNTTAEIDKLAEVVRNIKVH
ncbi:MAG: cysteine desulfurase [Candidatus Sumerlaeaceae bacterium]|nr:cysteine desulfurase [Candidatus Sumerlaeaceae bacterium]